MSDLLDPQTAATSAPDAKARAKADKAYAKAMRPWYKKKLVVIPAAIIGLAILSNGMGGDETAPTTNGAVESQIAKTNEDSDGKAARPAKDAKAPAEAAPKAAAGLGAAAQDGKFTFTVHSFDCGKNSVGSSFMKEKAQGQFCLMDITVANHGDEAQMLFSDNQYVYDSKGRQFSHDDMATMSMGDENQVWFEEINPGNKVRGTMVFDVPKGADIVTAELHDSMMSGGVVVDLQ